MWTTAVTTVSAATTNLAASAKFTPPMTKAPTAASASNRSATAVGSVGKPRRAPDTTPPLTTGVMTAVAAAGAACTGDGTAAAVAAESAAPLVEGGTVEDGAVVAPPRA